MEKTYKEREDQAFEDWKQLDNLTATTLEGAFRAGCSVGNAMGRASMVNALIKFAEQQERIV